MDPTPPKIEEDVLLSKFTTLHVGGPARCFGRAKNDADVLALLTFATNNDLPWFILGHGSNTLFADAGYPGLVIHMEDRTLLSKGTTITAASGTFMRQLVNFALGKSLRGLEELAGIPGTVGGAVRGNAGTWQTETKDYATTITYAKLADNTWQAVTLPSSEAAWGYRDSIFKHHPEWVILRADFKLPPGDKVEGQKIVAQDLVMRHLKQPYDAPSAGSIFKNPDRAGGVFSGSLIEAAGLKGEQRGGAQISPKHGNFIVNRGHASSQDVHDLITLVQRKVKQGSGIDLIPEIELVGF